MLNTIGAAGMAPLLWVLAGVIIALHRAGWRRGSPMLRVFLGGIIPLIAVQHLLPHSIDQPNPSVPAAELALLLGVLIIYAIEGPTLVAPLLAGLLVLALVAGALAPLLGAFTELFPLTSLATSMDLAAALRLQLLALIGMGLGMYALLAVYQALANRWPRRAHWLGSGLGLLIAAVILGAFHVVGETRDAASWMANLWPTFKIWMLGVVLLWPLTVLYLSYLRRRFGDPVSHPPFEALRQTFQIFSMMRDLERQASHAQLEAQEAYRKRSQELESLRQASLSVTSTLELPGVLEAILEHTLRLVAADDAHIFLYDGERLTFGAALWSDGRKGTPFAEPRKDGLTYTVARSGQRIVIPVANEDPIYSDWPWGGAIIGMPLTIGERVVGVMNVAFDQPHEFEESELRVLELLGDQAAVAIENARLFERSEAERRRVQLLYDVTQALASSLNPREIMQRAMELTTTALGGLFGDGFLLEPESDALRLYGSFGHVGISPEELDERVDMRVGKGVIGWIAAQRQPLLVADVRQDERWLPFPGIDDPVRSALGAPIMAGQELLGVMVFFHNRVGYFQQDHLDLLIAISRQVALALSNARRYGEVERRLMEFTLLQDVARVINRRLELKPLLEAVVEQVARVLGYPVVEIFLVEDNELVVAASNEKSTSSIRRIPLDMGVVGRSQRTGRAQLVPDVSHDPDYVEVLPSTGSEIAVPLSKGDVVIGVLNVESPQRNGLDENDLQLLTLLADQVSVAIENAALYERLRRHNEELERLVTARTTELEQALDQAREADRLKTQFVSDVSHELRTPLSNIRLYLDLLAQGRAERFETYLQTLNRETDRLVTLIEDLLAISRLDAGTVTPNMEPVDVNALAGGLVKDRRRLFAEKGLQLDLQPQADLPQVLADPRMLSQVMANLMTNALHYTPGGGRVVVATSLQNRDGQDWVTISVADTGVGIPESELLRIFDRFFRGAASRQMGTPGTGLGLAICKEILDRHGGGITVESREGKGSTFTVWLPPWKSAPLALAELESQREET